MVTILTLIMHAWVGSSRVYEGNNWVDVLKIPLEASGSILMIPSPGLLLKVSQEVVEGLLERRKRQLTR
jgi:hypothetical protein